MIGEDVMVASSETDQLRQQLLQAQKLSSVGALASSVAHEFNNILTTIINYAKMALRTPADEAGRTQALEKILKGSQRAATIINSMLGFARNTSTQREMTDLAALVEEVLILTEKDLSKHRIHVEKKFHGRPKASVVPAQIEQVLLNLIINARQAMPRGGHLRIEVRDNAQTRTGRDQGQRHRRGHPAGSAAADLRAVLHHEGTGRERPRRHRPGAERLPADHRTAPGPHPRREPGRQGLDVHGQAARHARRTAGLSTRRGWRAEPRKGPVTPSPFAAPASAWYRRRVRPGRRKRRGGCRPAASALPPMWTRTPRSSSERATSRAVPISRIHVEPDQVRFHLRRIESQARRVSDGLGDQTGVAMVLRQSLDVVIQRVQCRRRDHAGLAHAAAEQLADSRGRGR